MGTKARDERRRRQREERARAATQLKVAVVTTPNSESAGIDIRHEAALVKSALLYADTVELVSQSTTYIAIVKQLADNGRSGLADMFELFDDDLMAKMTKGPLNPNWRERLGNIRNPTTPQEQRQIEAVEAQFVTSPRI